MFYFDLFNVKIVFNHLEVQNLKNKTKSMKSFY